jgi:hypothetical protein
MNQLVAFDAERKSLRWAAIGKMAAGILVGLALLLVLLAPLTVQAGDPPGEGDFFEAAPQGFGDRQNGWPWSMQWWNGHLYVGTNRAWHCAEVASYHNLFPGSVPYPPNDPDVVCTDDPEDLPMQAEIWRWSPVTEVWQRVYQSPNDVLLPSGKYVSRDIGYRGMTVYTETNGTEALYVTGVSPKFIGFEGSNDMPPPRILRTTDGVNFETVPMTPGSALGNYPWPSLRNPFQDNGRFYMIGGLVQGSGVLFESRNPAAGDDEYEIVSAFLMFVSAAAPYNDQLYVGTNNLGGYRVFKTDNSGSPPYTYTLVIQNGGYLSPPNSEILTFQEFDGRLYGGGNGVVLRDDPAELIRINPDDSWDLVVGDPRETPDGWKYPLSGFPSGFGNDYNGHMWRLEPHEDNLYVGTFDSSTIYKDDPILEPQLRHLMGFDLWRTPNATEFYSVTTVGFGDKFNFGVRSMQSTPHGLFVGAANYYYGLQIWRAPRTFQAFLPAVTTGAGNRLGAVVAAGPIHGAALNPDWKSRLETTSTDRGVVVSWEPARGASRYRVLRAPLVTLLASDYPSLESDMTVWGQAVEVATTTDLFFVDSVAETDEKYIYFVEAHGSVGDMARSNIAPAPSFKPPADFDGIAASLGDYDRRGRITAGARNQLVAGLERARSAAEKSDFSEAAQAVADLQQQLEHPDQTLLTDWEAKDLAALLGRLARQIELVQKGALAVEAL